MTSDELRGYMAGLLEVPPSAITMDTDLSTLGLDSVRLMMTLEHLETLGHQPDFGVFAENPTLKAWMAVLSP